MAHLKSAVGVIAVALLLVLAAGCSGANAGSPASTPEAQPTGVASPQPSSTAPAAAAQPKLISQAKPIAATSGPRLALDVDSVDFGDVPFDAIVAFTFNVKNVGSAPVTLGEPFIRTNDGC